MELSQFLTFLLLAISLVTLVIVIIFIFINICISKRAAWYSTQAKPNYYDGSNFTKQEKQVHHKDLENEKPPLPPRDQFMSKESVDLSYEDVEPVPDYIVVEESTPPVPQVPKVTPHYTTVKTKIQDQDQDSEDYDDIDTPVNDDIEDYDDIETPVNDDTEDYDDIG